MYSLCHMNRRRNLSARWPRPGAARRRTVVLTCLTALAAGSGHAEVTLVDAPQAEIGIEVRAKAVPRPVAVAPVQRLTAQDGERAGARSVAEALAQVPGVQVHGPHNQRNGLSQVRIRGFESQYTLVLVDGQRQATRHANSAVDLNAMPLDGLAQIEVVRGPMAVLLGGDAIGGVVQIKGAPSSFGDRSRLRAGGGAFDTYQASGLMERKRGSGGWRLWAAHEQSRGWSDAWDLDRTLRQVTARSDARPTATTQGWLDAGWRTDGLGQWSVQAKVRRGAAEKQKVTQKYVETGERTGLESALDTSAQMNWRGRSGPSKAEASLAWSRTAVDREERYAATLHQAGRPSGQQVGIDREAVTEQLWLARGLLEHSAAGWLVRASVDARHRGRTSRNESEQRRWDETGILLQNAEFRKPERIYALGETETGGAVQVQAPGDRWVLTGGVRGDHHQFYGAFAGGAASLTLHALTWLDCHAAVGRGHKMPSLETRTRPVTPVLDSVAQVWRSGNPYLRPERADQAEVGIALRPAALQAGGTEGAGWHGGATVYVTRFEDKIQPTEQDNWQGSGLPLQTTVNLAGAQVAGAEVFAGWRSRDPRWQVRAHTTLLRTAQDQGAVRFDRTPHWLAGAQLSAPLPWSGGLMHVACRVQGAAPKILSDGRIDSSAGGAAMHNCNVRLEQGLGKGLVATVDFGNATNAQWDRDGDGDNDLLPPHGHAQLTWQL